MNLLQPQEMEQVEILRLQGAERGETIWLPWKKTLAGQGHDRNLRPAFLPQDDFRKLCHPAAAGLATLLCGQLPVKLIFQTVSAASIGYP